MRNTSIAHITFTHLYWKTEKCWKVLGYKNSLLSDINSVEAKWKVSMSENRIAAINENNDILILEEGKSWRSIHTQPISQVHAESKSITNCVLEDETQVINENIEETKSLGNSKEEGIHQKLKRKFEKILVDDKNLFVVDEDGHLYSGCIHIPLPGIQITDISIGAESYIALTKNGEVLTWGSGMRGQLGNGSLQAREEPEIVESLCGLGITQVAAGAWHCAALSESGDVYLWGWNESGQLGFLSKTLQENSQFPSHNHKCNCKNIDKTRDLENTILQTSTENEVFTSINEERSKEVINVQTSPKLLDFWHEDVNITSVACGDRHTVFTLGMVNLVWAMHVQEILQFAFQFWELRRSLLELGAHFYLLNNK